MSKLSVTSWLYLGDRYCEPLGEAKKCACCGKPTLKKYPIFKIKRSLVCETGDRPRCKKCGFILSVHSQTGGGHVYWFCVRCAIAYVTNAQMPYTARPVAYNGDKSSFKYEFGRRTWKMSVERAERKHVGISCLQRFSPNLISFGDILNITSKIKHQQLVISKCYRFNALPCWHIRTMIMYSPIDLLLFQAAYTELQGYPQ